MPVAAQNLKSADLAVIITLWIVKIYDSWLKLLIQNTYEVIFNDFSESSPFEWYLSKLLLVKCALTMIVGVLVDAYDHKYCVAVVGAVLYLLTVGFALCMCFTRRSFFALATWAMSSMIFVTSPAAFWLIFNQVLNPLRSHVRRLVSVMEFLEVVVLLTTQESLPEEVGRHKLFTVVASWVLAISLLVFILTILERIREYLSPDSLKEKGVVAIIKGLGNDIRGAPPRTGLSRTKVLFFMLLLLPSFSLTSLNAAVSNFKAGNASQFQDSSLKRTVSIAQLTVIPLTEVALTFAPIKEARAEMLVLGFAHILNIGVMTLMVLMASADSGHRSTAFNAVNRQSQSIARENEEEAVSLFMIINPSRGNVTLHDDPQLTLLNEPSTRLIPFFGVHSKHVYFTGNSISVRLNASIDRQRLPYSEVLNLERKTAHIVVIPREADSVDETLKFNILTDDFPQRPVLFALKTFGSLDVQDDVLLTTDTGSIIFNGSWSRRYEPQRLNVPEGRLNISLRNKPGSTSHSEPAESDFVIERGSFNFIVIGEGFTSDGVLRYNISSIVWFNENIPSTSTSTSSLPTPAPPASSLPTSAPPAKQDAVKHVTVSLTGATFGLTSVGYLSFFWMESPARLRATLFAWFLVSNEILGWITPLIVGDQIKFGLVITLLVLAIVTAIWHFVLGLYFDHRIRPGSARDGVLPPQIYQAKEDEPKPHRKVPDESKSTTSPEISEDTSRPSTTTWRKRFFGEFPPL